ncbi:MAG: hypothetical protein CL561_12960 [Alphaproteobacteria bacterium]|nr:hypothetical protein [Alphaproteobacteria bacterium]|tara:strand:- start:563 stop:1186 length:624 start_codon:yes stop_codon:yes gene_type:complete
MIKNKWREDDAFNVRQYTELLETHGLNHQSLDWGSERSQHKRFKILAEIGLTDNDSVLDIGCGLGDLFGWLKMHDYKNIQYKGIDITDALIKQAQVKYPSAVFESVNVLEGNYTTQFDYVFASGVFAKRNTDTANFAKTMIEKMFSFAQKGVAFNSLSSLSENLSADDNSLDPYGLLDFCRNLSPWTILRMDYHPHDFTIYIKREQS